MNVSKKKLRSESPLLAETATNGDKANGDQPEAKIKPMASAGGSQYDPEEGEPHPEKAETESHIGLYVFQQHGGAKKPCRSFHTVALSTKTEKRENSKVITRYRKCLKCGKRYSHITILKKLGDGMWTETGTGFSSE